MTQLMTLVISPVLGGIGGTISALVVEYYKSKHRYREPQLNLYMELWRSLNNLKSSADRLWETADASNLLDFITQLEETEQVINQSSILIEDNHIKQLRELIQSFRKFKTDKGELIILRKKQSRVDIDEGMIKITIDRNSQTKERYDRLVDEIEISFRRQIRTP